MDNRFCGLSDPRNRNHKSLAIANHNFEVASFSRRNRSEIAVLEFFWSRSDFFKVAIAVASDLLFEVAAIRVTKFVDIWAFLTFVAPQHHLSLPEFRPQT